jgi:hypothetical protein
MNFADAWARVSIAGRELGSGPAEAARRLIDMDEVIETLVKKGVDEDRAAVIMLGAAVGRVMAEDEIAMSILAQIESEWKENH